jgi:hypothetical protein
MDHNAQFVASLWTLGAPREFASEVLADARDWDHVRELAKQWAHHAIALGGTSEPTAWLHLKSGPESEFIGGWSRTQ